MNLKLIAIYLDESQLRYILACKESVSQDLFNFEFEYINSDDIFCQLHGVKVFPSFYLTKDDRIVSIIEGKLEYRELKERLLNTTYVKIKNDD